MGSVDYTELIRKTAYIFIEGGWAQITVGDDGIITQGPKSGNNLTTSAEGISATLRDADNQVNLDGAGYRDFEL